MVVLRLRCCALRACCAGGAAVLATLRVLRWRYCNGVATLAVLR